MPLMGHFSCQVEENCELLAYKTRSQIPKGPNFARRVGEVGKFSQNSRTSPFGDVFGVKKKVRGDLKATRQEDLVMELKTRLPELQSPTETWDENGATKPSVVA